jgi:hypothetical protein
VAASTSINIEANDHPHAAKQSPAASANDHPHAAKAISSSSTLKKQRTEAHFSIGQPHAAKARLLRSAAIVRRENEMKNYHRAKTKPYATRATNRKQEVSWDISLREQGRWAFVRRNG